MHSFIFLGGGGGAGETPRHNAPPIEDSLTSNGLVIGIVLGACAVLFIVFLIFLAYKIYRKRHRQEKYQSPSLPIRGTDPVTQVTLLPISPHRQPPNHYVSQVGRLPSDNDRRLTSCSSNGDLRPPPSYNESFLDNGGPVVAV